MKIILIFIALFFSYQVVSLGRVVSYDEVRTNLFASIQSIETCGNWRVGDGLENFGTFRVLNVYYAGQDMLFVDMVSLNKSGSELKVVYGFTFSEINNDHAEIELESITCKPIDKNKVKLNVSAINGNNDEKFNFSIIVDGLSRSYKYEESLLQ